MVAASCVSTTASAKPKPSVVTQASPPANGTVVYDVARKVLVLVTPGASQEIERLQTWTWDGRTWTRRMPATSPPTRSRALLAYDEARRVTILHGGVNRDPLTDTWEWDGSTWSQRHPVHAPVSEESGSLAYDRVSHRTLLFQSQQLTWSWDGQDWAQLRPSHTPNLWSGDLVFDRTRLILVGAWGNGDRTETWGWTGSDWTLLSTNRSLEPPAAPPVLDILHGKVVRFGGGPGDDTWTWDGSTWSRERPQHSPGNNSASSLVYDAAFGEVVALVGREQGKASALYGWNGADWHAIGASTPPAVVAGLGLVAASTAEPTIRRTVTNTGPILFPRLPAGVDQALVTADATGFSLLAMNQDRTIRVRFGIVVPGNSNLGAASKRLNFRHDDSYYQYIANDPTGWRSIWWMERPGHSTAVFGLKDSSGIPYALSATGLTEPEFFALAGTLH